MGKSFKVGVQGGTMSKDQKKTVEVPVETVENWSKTLSYIVTSLSFWKFDNEWPVNLCIDGMNAMSNQMYEITKGVSN